jgi:ribonuclease HI
MKIEVYTDGSATTNDKPGGWAYVMVVDGVKKAECAGFMQNASNNDAELQAAIEGLKSALNVMMEDPIATLMAEFYLVSDSQLILGWADGTYRFKQKEPEKIVKYHELQELIRKLKVKTRWVRGHNGDEHNERCDTLANEARLSLSRKIDKEEKLEKGETLIGTKKNGTICLWYKNSLKVIDLETNIVENYDRNVHGPRGAIFEIREEKSR